MTQAVSASVNVTVGAGPFGGNFGSAQAGKIFVEVGGENGHPFRFAAPFQNPS